MPIVNLKIIFVKKQKQTRERPTQDPSATFIITEMAVFTLETDYTCETGYFNDSEGLYETTVCLCLVRRPHYSARLMRFGSRGPSEFATEMP